MSLHLRNLIVTAFCMDYGLSCKVVTAELDKGVTDKHTYTPLGFLLGSWLHSEPGDKS